MVYKVVTITTCCVSRKFLGVPFFKRHCTQIRAYLFFTTMATEHAYSTTAATYSCTLKVCVGGDCKTNTGAETPLVKAGNSHWACSSCTYNTKMTSLVKSIEIASANRKDARPAIKLFQAAGGRVKYISFAMFR